MVASVAKDATADELRPAFPIRNESCFSDSDELRAAFPIRVRAHARRAIPCFEEVIEAKAVKRIPSIEQLDRRPESLFTPEAGFNKRGQPLALVNPPGLIVCPH
jgi:hypothetical protein